MNLNMSFKMGNNEQTYNIAIFGAIIVLALVAVLDLTYPRPNDNTARIQANREMATNTANLLASQKQRDIVLNTVDKFAWKIPVEKVSPAVLTAVTGLADKYQVTLSNFRPGKITELDTVTTIQYDSNVSGTYQNTSNFIRALEQPENLLAVQSLQVSNSDGVTDDVNINLSLIAAVDTSKTKKTEAKKS